MDRHELEDRIRAALSDHADDVDPSPELYRRARRQATTRTIRHRGFVAVGGLAAVAAIVAGAALLRPPPRVTIGPAVTDQASPSTGTESTPPGQARMPTPAPDPSDGARRTTVVATDGERILQLDPDDGEVVATLPAFEGFAEGAWVGDVAVRPGSGDPLTVASVIGLEGQSWEVEVSTFRDGRRVARHRAGTPVAAMDEPSRATPPTVVWSPDGSQLAWITRVDDHQALTVLDWEAALDDDTTVPAIVTTELGSSGPILQVQGWTGDPDGDSAIWLTGRGDDTGAVVHLSACTRSDCDTPQTAGQIASPGFAGRELVDVAHPTADTTLALVPTGARPGDGPETLLLLVEPDPGPPEGVLWLPEELGRGEVQDPWLAAGGEHVAVGDAGSPLSDDGRTWLLRTTGRADAEPPADGPDGLLVVDPDTAVRLPDAITAVDIAAVDDPTRRRDSPAEASTP